MNKILLSLSAMMASFSLLDATVVNGKISCDGTPVAGVSVSDGYNVVYSASDGSYKLKSSLDLGYVFISVPSGYEVPSDGVIPHFFQRVDPDAKTAKADFILAKVNQDKCNLIVYNDIHLTNDPVYHDIEQVTEGFLADVAEHYRTLADVPVYAMTLGDMTTDSRWYKRNYFPADYVKQVSGFPVPVFHAMGNHDNDIKGGDDIKATQAFRDAIGPFYYSFNIGAFHIIIFDDIVYDMPLGPDGKVEKSNGYKTYVSKEQLVWMRNDLKNVPESTPIIIASHAPLYRIAKAENGRYELNEGFSVGHSPEDVLYLLKKYKTVYILSGHTHMNYFVDLGNGVLEHNCVAVAGSSWYTENSMGVNLSSDGVPGGYAVYRIDGDSLSWYFKPSGIDVREGQFRAYDINTVPEKYAEKLPANTVLVNVFNYDPEWKVSMKENGKELNVTQVWVWDPLYAAGVDGQSFSKKGAFTPHRNSHMFSAQASSATSTIEITVTDRFGRVFTQTMTRPKEFGFNMPLGSGDK